VRSAIGNGLREQAEHGSGGEDPTQPSPETTRPADRRRGRVARGVAAAGYSRRPLLGCLPRYGRHLLQHAGGRPSAPHRGGRAPGLPGSTNGSGRTTSGRQDHASGSRLRPASGFGATRETSRAAPLALALLALLDVSRSFVLLGHSAHLLRAIGHRLATARSFIRWRST
jgi:hypothetical protein